MKRFMSYLIVPLFLANVAIAHPSSKTEDAAAQPAAAPFDVTDLKLPSRDEIKALTEQMPDMNAMMGDMQALMADDTFTGGMKDSMDILSKRMKTHTRNAGQDGMPDMNAMFSDMLGLMADEAFVGGMVDTLGPMQEMMEKHMPEAAKQMPALIPQADHAH